jgi:hypothetical protein
MRGVFLLGPDVFFGSQEKEGPEQAMHTKTIMIGLLRFSVLTPTYYSERFESLDKISEFIFSPERMALRFHLFENLCLPSLLNQTDSDFHCVVLTAKSMPKLYLERLQDLLAPVQNIHCRPVGPDKHYQLLKQAYNSVPIHDATHRLLFRLDDDDAVDLNFVARTKSFGAGLLALHQGTRPTIIAHNRGYYLRVQEGENDVFGAYERAPLSAGTALIAPVDYPRNPYRYNHRALAQHYNLYSDITVPGFIRTIHSDNKSTPTQMGRTDKKKPDEIAREILHSFGFDMPFLKAL